jgi:hypothetical protein
MFRIKDLCGWYGVGYEAMRKTLIAEKIIPTTDHGKGNRPRLSLSQLRPIFMKFGTPKGLTLSLEIK